MRHKDGNDFTGCMPSSFVLSRKSQDIWVPTFCRPFTVIKIDNQHVRSKIDTFSGSVLPFLSEAIVCKWFPRMSLPVAIGRIGHTSLERYNPSRGYWGHVSGFVHEQQAGLGWWPRAESSPLKPWGPRVGSLFLGGLLCEGSTWDKEQHMAVAQTNVPTWHLGKWSQIPKPA